MDSSSLKGANSNIWTTITSVRVDICCRFLSGTIPIFVPYFISLWCKKLRGRIWKWSKLLKKNLFWRQHYLNHWSGCWCCYTFLCKIIQLYCHCALSCQFKKKKKGEIQRSSFTPSFSPVRHLNNLYLGSRLWILVSTVKCCHIDLTLCFSASCFGSWCWGWHL